MTEEHKTYKVYAMLLNNENVEIANKERFHRMTPEYIMVFTQAEMPEMSYEIKAEDYNHLTEYDRKWIRDCAVAVAMEAVQAEDTAEKTMEILERIEKALQAQAEQISED